MTHVDLVIELDTNTSDVETIEQDDVKYVLDANHNDTLEGDYLSRVSIDHSVPSNDKSSKGNSLDLSDQENLFADHPVRTMNHLILLVGVNSNSSLGSLDEVPEPNITPATTSDHDTSTNNSALSEKLSFSAANLNGSHAAYCLANAAQFRKQRLQIYVSSPHKAILPVADPTNPRLRYLASRYRGFFGSENVPEGKYPSGKAPQHGGLSGSSYLEARIEEPDEAYGEAGQQSTEARACG